MYFVCFLAASFTAGEAESITINVVIGIISTVVAAMIISGSAWSINRIRTNSVIEGVEGFHVETASSVNISYSSRCTPISPAGSRASGRGALVSPNVPS